MKTTVNEAKTCPGCGRPTAKGALAGLCPACLLAQGIPTAADSEPSAPPRTRFEPPPVAEVSRLFPQLELLSLLGAGGMGAVYRARQPSLDRVVALKVLPSTGESGKAMAERFNREARALARLHHPNIVSVFEFGQVEGLHYFLMEFVDGTNLRQLEQAGRLSPREALQIIPQICDALQYAHDEGVVHRDIKPENVLVDRKGRVKIADFGLARLVDVDPGEARLTLEGQVMGTPHYMAPEQLERPLAVDHRADIYALGVVFYEMLTGDLPLGKFPPPSQKAVVDVRIDEVVLRALENDPERRYQHAGDVKTRIETIASAPDRVVPGNPPGEPWWRRRRGHILAAVLVLVALAGVYRLVQGRTAMAPGTATASGPVSGFATDTASPDIARPDPVSGNLVARLPGGGTMELIGLHDVNTGPDTWWGPDGVKLTNQTLEVRRLGTMPAASPVVAKEVAFRLTGAPATEDSPLFECQPAIQPLIGGEVFRDGARLVDGWALRSTWAPTVESGLLRIGFGIGEWRPVRVFDPRKQKARLVGQAEAALSRVRIVSAAPTNGGIEVVLTMGPDASVIIESTAWDRTAAPEPVRFPNVRMRVMAVDSGGVARAHEGVTEVLDQPTGGSTTWTYQFPGLDASHLSEIRIELQHVHWVEFRDVALKPRLH